MAKRVISVNPVAAAASAGQCKRMTKQDKTREERLAEALRQNLRRRKAQSREMIKPEPSKDER